MKVICIGYGRLGKPVVKLLQEKRHEVIVIDKERAAFEHHPEIDGVKFLFGNAIDEAVLRQAKAENADALFALTRDENSNLMVAQVARDVFKIPRIIAVVYDPAREDIYRAAGIETLPLTLAGAEFLLARLEAGPDSGITLESAWKHAHGHSVEEHLPTVPARVSGPGQPFYVIVVGGGRVGYFLTRALRENDVEVCIIEQTRETFDLVSTQVDCPVLFGDGSSTTLLEKAGAERANVFVAVTNHDQDNLIACQIAKHRFGVPKTIARVKNPRNEVLMQNLGVDITVSSTSIITNVIQSELPTSRMRSLLDLHAGGLELMEYHLDSESPVIGKTLREMEIPSDCNLVTIFRDGKGIVPRGETRLQEGDTVLAVVKTSAESSVQAFLLGP